MNILYNIEIIIYNLDYKSILKLLVCNKKLRYTILNLLSHIKFNINIDDTIHGIILNNNIYEKYIYECKKIKIIELYNKYKTTYNNELITIGLLDELILRTMPNIYNNLERELDVKFLKYVGAQINTIRNFKNLIDPTIHITFQNIVIPSVIIHINKYAFINCNLKSVVFHDNIIYIGIMAFFNNNLKYIKIPKLIKIIHSNSFANNQLNNIDLHDDIQIIDNYAFSHNNLFDIHIPKNCIIINREAFAYNLLTRIHIPPTIKYICSTTFLHNRISSLLI
jgi:hypothetical protein